MCISLETLPQINLLQIKDDLKKKWLKLNGHFWVRNIVFLFPGEFNLGSNSLAGHSNCLLAALCVTFMCSWVAGDFPPTFQFFIVLPPS